MIAAFAVLLALVLSAGSAIAQSSIRSLEIDDFGLTRQLTPGARPAGIGGAYTALVNDVHGLIYNPAGLAAIKRIEISLGAHHSRIEMEAEFYGDRSSIDARDGSMELASVAFPIPVIRGSLVGAAGVYRVFSSALDLHYSGPNSTSNTQDNFLLQQTGSIYEYNLGFGVDLAAVLSGGITGFLLDGNINSLRQFDFTFLPPDELRSVFVSDDVDMDVDGYGARLGAIFHIHRGLEVGLSFTTPVVIKMQGSAFTEVTDVIDNDIDTFIQTTAPVETEYILPARLDTGVAGTWRRFTLSVDVAYVDWTTTTIDGRRLRNQQLETLFREVVEVKAGVEVTLPWLPVRVRAGYANLPYPLKFLPADRIELQDMRRVTVDTERHRWGFGAGALVAGVIVFDAAYTYTSGERSVESLSQREELHNFVLTAAYRF